MTLGRGLDSLIPKKVATPPTSPLPDHPDQTVGGERIVSVPPTQIDPNPHQPRREFGHAELEDLVNSIREHGILQPLIVSRAGMGYQLIAGERRLRAAQALGLAVVPVIVREATEVEKLELAIIENVQRRDLNPLEEAAGYRRLIDEFSLTQEAVAQKVGKSRAAVANALRLLTLPELMQTALADGTLTEGHAKVLAGVTDPVDQQALFEKIISQELTVRQAESAAPARPGRGGKTPLPATPWLDAQRTAWEEQLRAALGTKVAIEQKGSRGRIVVEFYSDEELRGLVGKLSGDQVSDTL